MADFNKWIGTGRIVDEPKLTYNDKQTPILSFKIANNVGYGDYKRANFIPCKVYGKAAEVIKKYATKGSQLAIEGEVSWMSGKNDDGTYWNYTNVRVTDFNFLGGTKLQEKSESTAEYVSPSNTPPNPYAAAMDDDTDMGEEIPF